jgi:hypothetical protein
MYRQACGTAVVSVWDQYYGHYHLGFEDPSIGGCLVDGGFGRRIGSICLRPAWSFEPRSATSHAGGAWWEILLMDLNNGGRLRVFDLKTLAVGGRTNVQLWFRKADGSVWGWSDLPPGVNWSFGEAASRIVAAWISAGPGLTTPFTIEGFTIAADPH